MPRIGLTKEVITDAAIELIEERGNSNFSLNKLAQKLKVKPASLYNHIENMDELLLEITSKIAEMLRAVELKAIKNKHEDDALYALCEAYRDFANKHIELYMLNAGRQPVGHDFEKAAKGEIVDPISLVLSDYKLSQEEKPYWHRIIRALLHGHITQEHFVNSHSTAIDSTRMYRMGIKNVILGIRDAEKQHFDPIGRSDA